MSTLLKSAIIIDANSQFNNQKKDILITNGVIEKIEDSIPTKSHFTVVALENLHVSNGWFDTSVCFGEPGYEERETITNGLHTAAKSGFTAVAVNPNTAPIVDNKSAVEYLKNKAHGCATKLFPIAALTQQSQGKEMAELYDMQQSGAVAFGDYNSPIENDNLMKVALLYAQNFNGLVMSFPKNLSIGGEGLVHEGINSTKLGLKGIPALAEHLQIARDLFLLEYTGGKLHIPTISTEASVTLINEAKKKGLQVTCSVSAHHLILTDDVLTTFDGNFKVTPPLRAKKDCTALVEGVKNGTIDIITSDHNPIDIEHKKVEFSAAKSGTIGLESLFGAINTKLSLSESIDCITTKPKAIFNIEQSPIAVGEKADITLFDPNKKYTFNKEHILSTSKNAVFLGKSLKGKAYGIFANNQLVIH